VNFGGIFDYPNLKARLGELESIMAEPGFWDHKERAQQVIDEASSVRSKTLPFSQLAEKADDLEVLLSLAPIDGFP
jgi:peptide chain release factor 2